ncbi:MAG: M3 family metallopeptidase [Anderseniella sp.]|jgi:peptidyl-dipeptidase Dcp|nr:M3 family metallopeptidase [Anderseniella sp.]
MPEKTRLNPALTEWNGAYGLPEFGKISEGDLGPAFEVAMAEHLAEIEAIAGNPEQPDLANTVEALELAGQSLRRVSALFWHRAGTDSTPAIQALEREIGPALASHSAQVYMNGKLFARIATLHQRRHDLGLTAEQQRVLELHYKHFVKEGARLDDAGKQRLAEINQRLAALAAEFGQNVLSDEASWVLPLTGDDLEGLPDSLTAALAEAARERKVDAPYAVTLGRSIAVPFLVSSFRRDLREKMFKAWSARGEMSDGKLNAAVVSETLKLRHEKAGLLGYDSFAALRLDGTMAKTPGAVEDLLGAVWPAALHSASEHQAQLEVMAAEDGINDGLRPWDWRHYSGKLRQKLYDLDEAALKPYFQLDRMIEAAFDVAGRLFGISFRERQDISGPHPEARVFEVRESDGSLKGIFVADYFARVSKRSGAWMNLFRKQHKLGNGELPVVFNVMNFARPSEGKPALLSLDDATTLFHEFGHALHGLLSDVTYPSVSGTSVSRDFVELPSQLYEHWLTVPEVLRKHARHAETDQPIPPELLDKVLAARTFDAGFDAIEYTASALVDIRTHSQPGSTAVADPLAYEAALLAELAMPAAITMRHRTPHFLHVYYGDGYAAGYYSYMWSEVLDADAFAAFEETGDPFDPETAARLRKAVYASGNSMPPEDAYKAFRQRLPTADAMIAKRGLSPVSAAQ